MPEQFSSFNPQGPTIDPLLFAHAQQIGTDIGNATPNTAGAIFQGVDKGIQSGISTYSGIQGIQSNAEKIKAQKAENQVNTDPAVIEAKRQQEIARGQTASYDGQVAVLNSEILSNNEEIAKQTTLDKLKLGAAETAQKLGDITNSNEIVGALQSSDPNVLAGILKNSAYAATMTRDPNLAAHVLGGLEGKVDPALITSARNQFDAVELEKRRIQQVNDSEKRKQAYADKTQQDFTESVNSLNGLRGFSEVSDLNKNPDYNYRDVKIYGADEVQPDPNTPGKLTTDPVTGQPVKPKGAATLNTPDKTYYLAYGDKILDTLNHDEGRKYSEVLSKYKTGASARGYIAPDKPSETAVPAPSPVSDAGNGLAGMTAAPVTTGDVNQNIINQAKIRNDNAFKQAQTLGQSGSYNALMKQGAELARPKVEQPNYIQTPQTVPVPAGQPKLTQPVDPAKEQALADMFDDRTPFNSKVRLGGLLGVNPNDVSLNVNVDKPVVTPAVFKNVNNIPALIGQPAIIKGMAAAESAGNPDAVSPAGAEGLMQIMPATGKDLGLKEGEAFDPSKAVPAAVKYNADQYDRIQKVLTQEMSKQGIVGQPDPRMVLAAYNGGLKWILQGVSAGNLTWDDMKSYLVANKNAKAAAENIAYPDRVISASIPFMVGGNASDDALMRSYISFGIVDVNV